MEGVSNRRQYSRRPEIFKPIKMKSKKVKELIDHNIAMGRLSFTIADIEYCVNIAEREAEEAYFADREKFRESTQTFTKEVKNIKDEWEKDLTMWRGIIGSKFVRFPNEPQKALCYAAVISAMKVDLEKLIEKQNNFDHEKNNV